MPLPADISLTEDDLNKLFQRLTALMLDYDISAWEDYLAKVAAGTWPAKGPRPHQSILFCEGQLAHWWRRCAARMGHCRECVLCAGVGIDNPYNRLRDVIYAHQEDDPDIADQTTGYTRVLRVYWNCYGPSGWTNARKIMDRIFYQQFRTTPQPIGTST